MAFSESPAITVREVDASGTVPAVSSSTGGFVGNFRWGPVNTPTLISNEAGLVTTFGAPNATSTVDFHSAAYFLKYTNALQVVRVLGDSDGFNAYSVESGEAVAGKNVRITDVNQFDAAKAGLDSDKHTFIAKWPGTLGNSLKISVCPQASSASVFTGWTYANNFDAAPGTSNFAEGLNATNDELHVAVVDEDGAFTGTRGTVLETFPFVSVAKNAKTSDGSTNFVKDVINRTSNYIWCGGFDSDYSVALAGQDAVSSRDFQKSSAAQVVKEYSLTEGDESENMDVGDYINGYDKFEDKDNIQVDLLIAPQMASRTDTTTIVNDLVSIAQGTRKDCVVVTSPARTDVVGATTPVTNTTDTSATFTSSSYLVMDNNYLKVYDKYNDEFIHIPAASSTAGIMAATDVSAAAWYSPAGPRRGQYLGVTGIAYSPNKAERDVLYRNGVNPIANIPGQGLLLFGDKTKLARPSAFDRINVRRLFLVIERAIALAARNVMFEFNDEFTRAEFTGVVEPFLRDIKGRRGITDFRVICDETNNTGAVIDRNEFVATVLVKPARSINFVTLNFVAVRTGVDFSEVAGAV
jgi:phage tail sheath protein FI